MADDDQVIQDDGLPTNGMPQDDTDSDSGAGLTQDDQQDVQNDDELQEALSEDDEDDTGAADDDSDDVERDTSA